MRILCLHGVGSSGSICATQFAPLLKVVDPSYEFVFVDGPAPSERGPGMDVFPDGSFLSHTSGYSPSEMQEAHEHLSNIISSSGPFDGVLGFSQGAAVAISYIHHLQSLGEAPSFKFALFFSSVLPCSSNSSFGRDVIEILRSRRLDEFPTDIEGLGLTSREKTFVETLARTVIPAKTHNALLPDFDLDVYLRSDESEAPRIMIPEFVEEKIRIPTVHVVGKRDAGFMRQMTEVARGCCEEGSARLIEHSGGHHPPMKGQEVRKILRALEWAAEMGERTSE